MEKPKQERKVIHLQIKDNHYYFGSIESLFDNFDEEVLGFSKYQIRNNLRKKGIMENDICTIRQGFLITKQKRK